MHTTAYTEFSCHCAYIFSFDVESNATKNQVLTTLSNLPGVGSHGIVRMLSVSGWKSLPNYSGWHATTGLQSRDVLQPLRVSCLQLSRRLGEAAPVYVMLLFLETLPNQRLAPNIKARGSIDFDSSMTGFVKRVTHVICSYIVFVCIVS